MNLTPDKQGYLGNLEDKTLPELEELLERQQKILKKGKFLEKLPDKGEKTKAFANHLRKLIEKRLLVSNRTSVSVASDQHGTDCELSSEEKGTEGTNHTFKSEDLLNAFENLSVGNAKPSFEAVPANSYERVIKNNELRKEKAKPRFVPNKLPQGSQTKTVFASMDTSNRHHRNVLKEESAACPPIYKHDETRLISIEESIELISQQKSQQEDLLSQRAASRLAEKFIKMDVYTPSSTDMEYRDGTSHSTKAYDSDDDDSDDIGDEDNE